MNVSALCFEVPYSDYALGPVDSDSMWIAFYHDSECSDGYPNANVDALAVKWSGTWVEQTWFST